MTKKTIAFRDLYLSAFLKASGFPLHDSILDDRGRTVFHFLETPHLTESLREFYSGNALVNPSTFIESFKALRSLAYSLSERSHANE